MRPQEAFVRGQRRGIQNDVVIFVNEDNACQRAHSKKFRHLCNTCLKTSRGGTMGVETSQAQTVSKLREWFSEPFMDAWAFPVQATSRSQPADAFRSAPVQYYLVFFFLEWLELAGFYFSVLRLDCPALLLLRWSCLLRATGRVTRDRSHPLLLKAWRCSIRLATRSRRSFMTG